MCYLSEKNSLKIFQLGKIKVVYDDDDCLLLFMHDNLFSSTTFLGKQNVCVDNRVSRQFERSTIRKVDNSKGRQLSRYTIIRSTLGNYDIWKGPQLRWSTIGKDDNRDG